LHELQMVPSTPPLQRVLPGEGVSQRPTDRPAAMLQIPPQQSRGFEQISSFCAQNEEPRSQIPALHSFEQHSPPVVHALPAVRHDPPSGAHLPPEQLPPQHCASAVHAPLSATQAVPSQTPPAHTKEQQSMGELQRLPAATHRPMLEMQLCSTGSQKPEQQSPLASHACPVTPQALASTVSFPPPIGPLADEPPQLAATIATTKSQMMRVDMGLLPVRKRGHAPFTRCSARPRPRLGPMRNAPFYGGAMLSACRAAERELGDMVTSVTGGDRSSDLQERALGRAISRGHSLRGRAIAAVSWRCNGLQPKL
jgi:hypothetical protein